MGATQAKPWAGRRGLTLVALPLLLLLTGARVTVSVPPQLATGATVSGQSGVPITVKVGETVMTAKVFDLDRATISAPFHAKIERFEQDFDSGSDLTAYIVPLSTQKATGSSSTVYQCGKDVRVRSDLAATMVGDLFSKWETIVRFCFIDSDGDAKFDHLVLSGAKDKAFQTPIAIDPLPYATARITPDQNGGELRVVLKRVDPFSGKVDLDVEFWKGKTKQSFDYILCGVYRGGRFQPPVKCWTRFYANPAKTPYPTYFNDVLGGALKVASVDQAKGEAQFVVTKPIGPVLFKPFVQTVQYIYIYH